MFAFTVFKQELNDSKHYKTLIIAQNRSRARPSEYWAEHEHDSATVGFHSHTAHSGKPYQWCTGNRPALWRVRYLSLFSLSPLSCLITSFWPALSWTSGRSRSRSRCGVSPRFRCQQKLLSLHKFKFSFQAFVYLAYFARRVLAGAQTCLRSELLFYICPLAEIHRARRLLLAVPSTTISSST